jgi:hypothetical protein
MFDDVENVAVQIDSPPCEIIEGVQLPLVLAGSANVAANPRIIMNPGCVSDASNTRVEPAAFAFGKYAISRQFNAP